MNFVYRKFQRTITSLRLSTRRESLLITQKGVSLVEVILGIVVAVAVLLMLTNLPPALKSIGNSGSKSLAKDIAVKRVEDVRSAGYNSLANGTTTFGDSRFLKLPGGTGQTIVENCPSTICTLNEQLKKVTVTVSWQEAGKTQQVNIVTMVSQGGLK